MHDTKWVDGVETRVVEERVTEDGNLTEVARNYFAICQNTNSVFYFGEEVDNFVNGQLANHDGSRLAGVMNARPEVVMLGIILLGSRYSQEVAPGGALDRAEIVSTSNVVHTKAGVFKIRLRTEETTPLHRLEIDRVGTNAIDLTPLR